MTAVSTQPIMGPMQSEAQVQLFAVEADGPRPLPVPPGVTSFDGLYDGLALGVYSALCTFAHNKFLYLQQHIDRTKRSAQLLGWQYDLDEGRLRRALHETCSAYPFANARVRFDILAEPAARLGSTSRELVGLMPFAGIPASYYEDGVSVGFAQTLQRERPLAKTADFAQARRPYAHKSEHYEFLLLGAGGTILEGTGTNFYAVKNGVFHTAGSGVLEGITRKILLDLAAGLGIPLNLEAVTVADIPALEEAAISGSSRGLVPVVQIEEQVVGDGRPGPICQRLLSAYNTFVSEQIKLAIE